LSFSLMKRTKNHRCTAFYTLQKLVNPKQNKLALIAFVIFIFICQIVANICFTAVYAQTVFCFKRIFCTTR
jgi:hypothetical protein